MSVSEKQAASNRLNAQKSTGPRTPEGKARVAQNALKHGLYASKSIVNSPHLREDRVQFDLLYQAAVEDLAPETLFQQALVERIVECLWRQRRVVAAETAQIHCQLDRVEGDLRVDSILNRRRGNFPLRPKDTESQGESAEPKTPVDPAAEAEHRAIRIDARLIPDESFSRNSLRYEFRMSRELIRNYELFDRIKSARHERSKPRKIKKMKKIKCVETNPDEDANFQL